MTLNATERVSAARQRTLDLYGPDYSAHYRKSDGPEAETRYYQELSERLSGLAESFGRRVDVIDFGCGTGRYFHAMGSADNLHGIDLSEHMLEQARSPVIPNAARALRLLHGGIERLDGFEAGSIDLVYSIGVLGDHRPLDVEICNTVHRVLRVGGIFYYSVADADNRKLRPPSFKRKVVEMFYPLLPSKMKKKLDARWLDLSLHDYEIAAIAKASRFGDVVIERETILPESWWGRHYYCTMRKQGLTSS